MRRVLALAAVPLLAACVSMPSGPSVMVLPGTGKNFDQFRAEDNDCRQYASSQVGGNTPDGAAENSGVKSAVVGTAIGAAVGALVGGRNPVATGAGIGLASGAAMGSGAANQSQYELQRRYDVAYQQCMYARGNQIPGVSGGGNGYSRRQAAPYARPATPPPPNAPPPSSSAAAVPPPPAGAPPPPPPGVSN